jgi:hypothetical protein
VLNLIHHLDLREKRLVEALRCRSKPRPAESLIEALMKKVVNPIFWSKIWITPRERLCQRAGVVSSVNLETRFWHTEEKAESNDDN